MRFSVQAGVQLHPKTGAIMVDEYSRSTCPSIWAVGDVTDRMNLTPVALMEVGSQGLPYSGIREGAVRLTFEESMDRILSGYLISHALTRVLVPRPQ